MHCSTDSIGFPSADILGVFNDVRWPEWTGEVRREVPASQEDSDFRDQKKAPKQAGGQVCKQENPQRKAPGLSVQSL